MKECLVKWNSKERVTCKETEAKKKGIQIKVEDISTMTDLLYKGNNDIQWQYVQSLISL